MHQVAIVMIGIAYILPRRIIALLGAAVAVPIQPLIQIQPNGNLYTAPPNLTQLDGRVRKQLPTVIQPIGTVYIVQHKAIVLDGKCRIYCQ